MYCGTVLERSFLMTQSTAVCAVYANGTLTFGSDRVVSLRTSVRRVVVPPGAVEEFRLR
jgi:hypothetical protein